jgi:hypothetical protein
VQFFQAAQVDLEAPPLRAPAPARSARQARRQGHEGRGSKSLRTPNRLPTRARGVAGCGARMGGGYARAMCTNKHSTHKADRPNKAASSVR